jgi:arsenate reductase (thioredoxin)
MVKRQVLFLCTGNSCRSQIAEAIVNARMSDAWQAYSAGTHPTGFVHPIAIEVLAEIGIEHAGRSKSIEDIRDIPFDLVVTVCDTAAEECPLWLGSGKRLHESFSDPARITGSEAEIIAAFRSVRDDIARKIPPLLKQDFI